MNARCTLCMGALKIFESPWVVNSTQVRRRLFLPNFLMGFCSDRSYEFEVRSFTHSWDNRGYSKNLGSLWMRPRSLFSQIFNVLLFRWTLSKFFEYPLLSQERVKLRTSNFVSTFIGWSEQTPIKNSGKVSVGVLRDSGRFSGHPYIGHIVRSSLR